MSELFRQQAIENRQEGLLGDVTVIVPRGYTIFITFFCGLILSALLSLTFLPHIHEQNVKGYLLPSKGLIRIASPKPGFIAVAKAVDGQYVHKGDILFFVSASRSTRDVPDIGVALIAYVKQKIEVINQHISLTQQDEEVRLEKIRADIKLDNIKIYGLKKQIRNSLKSLSIDRVTLKRYKASRDAGITSETEYEHHYQELLTRESQLANLKLKLAEAESDSANASNRISRQKIASEMIVAELQSRVIDEKQRLTTLQVQASVGIKAPVDGTVIGVSADIGQRVNKDTRLAEIIPADSRLQALLMVPGSAIGKLKEGQAVLIEYDAFPYNQFGYRHGVIKHVAKTVFSAAAVHAPVRNGPQFYPVRVDLDSQSITANGNVFSLRPGMTMRAHIVLSKESWMAWLLGKITMGGS